MLVAGAFRTAYTQSQSPSSNARHTGHAVTDTQPVSDEPAAAAAAVANDCEMAGTSSERDHTSRQHRLRQQQQQQSCDVMTQVRCEVMTICLTVSS